MISCIKKSSKTSTILISIFFLTQVLVIQKAWAAAVPFGGLEVYEMPCTCTGGALFWHVFAPLFLGGAPVAGALAAPSTPLVYPSYYLKVKSWALGLYTPGAGSACYIGVTPYCYPLPNYGLVLPTTGTSPI